MGYWSKALPLFVDNSFPFEEQLLTPALVAECLTVDHQVTMQTELPIASWVLYAPSSHKVGHVQQKSIIKWKWYIGDQARASPECTKSYMKEFPQIPIV